MSGIEFSETGADIFEKSSKYYYQFLSDNGSSVAVLRDEAPPTITDGKGGWTVVDRRRRKGLTTWGGRNPLRMDVPILFNGWYDPPYSVDRDINILSMMAQGDNFVQPPTVTVEGYLPVQGITWVIEDLKWGSNQIWVLSDEGETIRVRQDCVVNLLQFVKEDVAKVSNINQIPPSNYIPPHVVRAGETPKSIAKATYGVGLMWKEIRKLNPEAHIRGAYDILKPGITLQMPLRHHN